MISKLVHPGLCLKTGQSSQGGGRVDSKDRKDRSTFATDSGGRLKRL